MSPDALVPWIAVGFVFVLALAGVFYARHLSRRLKAVRAAVIERYGLADKAPNGLLPDLQGSVAGHDVRVDVVQLHYRSSADSSTQRPWTRVRVDLREPTELVVVPRSSAEQQGLVTGDAAFDRAYSVSGPEEALRRHLTASQRQAWLALQQPMRLDEGVLTWMQLKHVRNPEVLIGAIEECLRVARAMDPPAVA